MSSKEKLKNAKECRIKGNYDAALEIYQEYEKNTKDKEQLADMYCDKAFLYLAVGANDKAEEYAKQGIALESKQQKINELLNRYFWMAKYRMARNYYINNDKQKISDIELGADSLNDDILLIQLSIQALQAPLHCNAELDKIEKIIGQADSDNAKLIYANNFVTLCNTIGKDTRAQEIANKFVDNVTASTLEVHEELWILNTKAMMDLSQFCKTKDEQMKKRVESTFKRAIELSQSCRYSDGPELIDFLLMLYQNAIFFQATVGNAKEVYNIMELARVKLQQYLCRDIKENKEQVINEKKALTEKECILSYCITEDEKKNIFMVVVGKFGKDLELCSTQVSPDFRQKLADLKASLALQQLPPSFADNWELIIAEISASLFPETMGQWLKGKERLIIVPDEDMWMIPWNGLRLWDSYLSSLFEVVLVPSATHYLTSSCTLDFLKEPPKAKVSYLQIDDSELDFEKEIEAIKHCESTVINTKADLIQSLTAQQDYIHIAGHCGLTDGEASFELTNDEGEEEYFTYEDIPKPVGFKHGFLACCTTSAGTFSGASWKGFVRSFLSAGSEAVISTVCFVNDGITIEISRGYYKSLFEGLNAFKAVLDQRNTEFGHLSEAEFWQSCFAFTLFV